MNFCTCDAIFVMLAKLMCELQLYKFEKKLFLCYYYCKCADSYCNVSVMFGLTNNCVRHFVYGTELEITSFTSNPDGYGIRDGQVTFSCQFSPILDPGITVIQWYRNNEMVDTTGANEDYSIARFQPSHSGNYSCSVLVMIGSVVLGGATSVEKSVRLAGTSCTRL